MTKNLLIAIAFILLISSCQKTKENIAPPLAPSTLTASASSTSQIDLSWTDNSTTEDGFKIERKTGAEAYKEIASINKDITTYQDKGLSRATSYTYRVYAYNNGGKSPTYTNEATASTLDDVPTAATNLTATALAYNQISLTWEDKASNETGYKVERKSGTDAFTLLTTLAANTTTYKDESVVENVEYTYRIYPINVSGNGPFSNEAKALTPVDLVSGLVAYYPFTGNAEDSSGNGNHGIVYGATLSTDRNGKTNQAYLFNLTNLCYINVPFSNSLNSIQNSFSTSAWIYMDGGTDASIPPRVLELRGAYGNGGDAGFAILPHSNSNISRAFEVRWYNKNGEINISIYPTSPVSALSWHHIVFTADGVNAVGKFYIDGVLVNTNSSMSMQGTINFCNYNKNPLIIGAEPNLLGRWGGKLDDIRIYNRALSQDQITYLSTH